MVSTNKKLKKKKVWSCSPLQLVVGEKEEDQKKKNKKNEEGGAPIGDVMPCQRRAPCAPNQRLCEEAAPTIRQGTKAWHHAT